MNFIKTGLLLCFFFIHTLFSAASSAPENSLPYLAGADEELEMLGESFCDDFSMLTIAPDSPRAPQANEPGAVPFFELFENIRQDHTTNTRRNEEIEQAAALQPEADTSEDLQPEADTPEKQLAERIKRLRLSRRQPLRRQSNRAGSSSEQAVDDSGDESALQESSLVDSFTESRPASSSSTAKRTRLLTRRSEPVAADFLSDDSSDSQLDD